jgi:thiosulfate dehydrogenase
MEAYLEFLSKDIKSEEDITWRMTNNMEKVPEPNVSRGEELYNEKTCMACHAADGSGDYGPPLWGEGSFNEAAGLTRLSKAAAFIQNNMPKGKPGTLTDQDAADIAAFLLSHERPIADPKKVGDYHLSPERDYLTKERRKKIRNDAFDWTTLEPVIPAIKDYN